MSVFFEAQRGPVEERPGVSRRSRALVWTAIILVATFIALSGFSSLWTERMWFRSVGFGQVFSNLLWTRVALFVGFGALMAAAVAASMIVAYRLRPVFRMASPEQAGLDRYREAVAPIRVWLVLGVSLLVGAFAGASATGQWRTFMLWRNGVPFGKKDAYFGNDIGFYVFDLPWLHFLVDFVMATSVVALMAAVVVHYLFGGIQLQARHDKFSPAAQAQVSVLLGIFVLAKAGDYWLGRYDLLNQSGSLFTGVNYTADNALLPARNILTWIAVICAVLFFLNVWRRTWRLATAGPGLLVLSAVLLGMIWPGLVQQFQVDPSEADKEAPYLQRNIDATREAYDIGDVVMESYNGNSALPPEELAQAALDSPGIRLVDPRRVQPLFEQKQQVRGYYSVSDVLDVDRYSIPTSPGGPVRERDLVLGVRELEQDGLPADSKNWANLHTVYTHGYGVIAAYGNQRPASDAAQLNTEDAAWAERDIPPNGQLTDLSEDGYQGRIYFGENSPEYSLVGRAPAATKGIELDLPAGSEEGSGETTNTYDGAAGVPVGNLFHKLLFAVRYGEPNIVLSERVHENSKIIYHRNPRTMVEKVAPWLIVDEDPFPAVIDGRVVWLLDGYTVTDQYPLSQKSSFEEMIDDSLAQNIGFQTLPTDQINYMRNAVKAVVDAYDGTVTLYAWDESDPMLQAWRSAFPGTIEDRSEIPDSLLAHMRYPEDLFKVQRFQLAQYHVTDPADFYEHNDEWAVPVDPDQRSTQQPPYRLTVETPSGGDTPTFSLTSVYVPYQRSNLAAFLSVDAEADKEGYGTLRVLRLSSTSQIPGPGQIANQFGANETIQNELVAFTRTNSKAVYGNLLTLPVGGGLLYVQPLYALRQEGAGNYPVLKFVLVALGSESGIGTTLEEAINDVLELEPGTTPPDTTPPDGPGGEGEGEGEPTGSLSAQVRNLLVKADAEFDAAEAALEAGDLAEYAERTDQAQEYVKQALALAERQSRKPAATEGSGT